MKGIIINEDFSHYFTDRGIAGATEEKLRELTEHYCTGQVCEVVYNFIAQRANAANLNVEPIWHGTVDKGQQGIFFHSKALDERQSAWVRCAKLLHEKKIDPYKVWLEETRKRKRCASLSIRMNDCHGIGDPLHLNHAEFWRDHPHFQLAPPALAAGYPAYTMAALDYTHRQVREYKLDIIKAALQRYDVDGLELDWMRNGNNTGLSNMDAGRDAITDFHRQVRILADEAEKRVCHPIQISARVSAKPGDAFARGLDTAAWVRENLVQRIVPTAFFSTSDTNMPIAFWRSMLGEKVEICAGLELLIRPFPASDAMTESLALLSGQAADYFYQGADCIYLFNHMDSDTAMRNKQDYWNALKTIGSPETAFAAKRRHILTFQDTASFGQPVKNLLPMFLPSGDFSGILRLSIGEKPRKDRTCKLILGFDTPEIPEMDVWLNNTALPLIKTFANEDKGLDEKMAYPLQSRQYFPKSSIFLAEFDAAEAVVSGSNMILVKNKENGKNCNITWTEIEIAEE